MSAAKKKQKSKSKPKNKQQQQQKKRAAPPPPKTTKVKKMAPLPAIERFDRASYQVPMMALDEALTLADALLTAKPKAATAIADDARRLTVVRERAKNLVGARASSDVPDARPFDVAMDRAWATIVRRVRDHAELPVERHPDAIEAAKVYAVVHDLSILKLNYLAEFAQIGARLDSLKREGLFDAARTFAGAAFVDEVLHCHAKYGEALGLMGPEREHGQEQESSGAEASEAAPPTMASPLDRGEARLQLIEAIEEYTYQVLALARPGQQDNWRVVRDALEPIARLRARQAEDHRAKEPSRSPAPHPPIAKTSAKTLIGMG